MQITSTISLAIVVALVVFRAPAALRRPNARPTWLSSVFAVLGLLTLGFVVPLSIVDRALGGDNNWALAEAIAATCSFWFMFRAMEVLAGRRSSRRAGLYPVAVMTSFTILFFLIRDRGPTTDTFVTDHLDQFACWLCVVIYLLGLASISGVSLWVIRKKRRGVFPLFAVGYLFVTLAALSDTSYLTLSRYEIGDASMRLIFWNAFTVLFYAGVLILVSGFFAIFVRRVAKELQPVWRVRAVRMQAILGRVRGSRAGIAEAWLTARHAEPVTHAYDSVVQIRDHEIFDDTILTPAESSSVERVEKALERTPGLRQFASVRGSSQPVAERRSS